MRSKVNSHWHSISFACRLAVTLKPKQSERIRYLYNSCRLVPASCMDCIVSFVFSDKLDRQDETLVNSVTDGTETRQGWHKQVPTVRVVRASL